MVDEDALRARFSLVEIDDEGVLLDREGGGVFQLNRTACGIWAEFKRGASPRTIAMRLVKRFGIAPEIAERDARSALADLPTSDASGIVRRADPAGGQWEESPAGYTFREGDVVICEVDRQGTSLRLPSWPQPTASEARRRIRSVVARVLALRGIHLLHASAVEIGGSLTVFTGPSGAGKTTIARSLARGGARLVSEDLLVLSSGSTEPRAVISGEATIRKWVHDQATHLTNHPVEAIACHGLDASASGADLSVSQVLLIDAGRRFGEGIRLERLPPAGALVAMMNSIYFASVDADNWLARIEMLRNIVKSAHTSIATMPSGLSALDRAIPALNQSEMVAS